MPGYSYSAALAFHHGPCALGVKFCKHLLQIVQRKAALLYRVARAVDLLQQMLGFGGQLLRFEAFELAFDFNHQQAFFQVVDGDDVDFVFALVVPVAADAVELT